MNNFSLKSFFPFVEKYSSLEEVLNDNDLAALGDAYINFIYSLALSKAAGKPVGRKLDSLTLSLALKKSDLRKFLPRRVDRHKQADAAEALIVYGWLLGVISIEEAVRILSHKDEIIENLSELLRTILERSHLKHTS